MVSLRDELSSRLPRRFAARNDTGDKTQKTFFSHSDIVRQVSQWYFALRQSDIKASRLLWYYIRLPNSQSEYHLDKVQISLRSNITRRKANITKAHSEECALISSFKSGLAGQVDAQPLKYLFVHLGEDHRRMDLTTTKIAQLLHRPFRHRIGHCTNG